MFSVVRKFSQVLTEKKNKQTHTQVRWYLVDDSSFVKAF